MGDGEWLEFLHNEDRGWEIRDEEWDRDGIGMRKGWMRGVGWLYDMLKR